jgi:hypothetical protein
MERLQLQVTANQKTHQFSFRFYGLLVSSSQADSQDFINEKYYEFEKQHPEYSIDDIVNPDVMLRLGACIGRGACHNILPLI